MTDKYDNFAPYVSEGENPEEAEQERQRILREQMEFELLEQAQRIGRRLNKTSEIDE